MFEILAIIGILALSFVASIIGVVSGVGSGIMIKPALELATPLDILHVNLFSGSAVFVMALTAIIRQRASLKDFKFRIGVPLAIGSAAGGVIGNIIFGRMGDDLAVVQSVLMLVVIGVLLLHQIFESKIKGFNFERVITYLILGVILGMTAAFLGIGGGPLNLSALGFFAGMNLATAALYSIFVITFAQGANLIRWGVFSADGFPAVDPALLIAVLVGSVVGALIGSSLYKKVKGTEKGNSILKKMYSAVLIFVIIATVINLVMYL